MSQEVLYVLLDQYADHEVAFLAQAINTDQQGTRTNPKYHNKFVAPTLDLVTSAGGLRTLPDYSFDTMPTDFAALVLIGSPLWLSPVADPLKPVVQSAMDQGKVIGAICLATAWMARHGFLNHTPHTGNGIQQLLQLGGAGYTNQAGYVNEQAVRHHNMVTANGSAHLEFAREMQLSLDLDPAPVVEGWYQFYSQGLVKLFAPQS